MKDRRILMLVFGLGLSLALVVGLAVAQAQGPEPAEGHSAPLGTRFTYQGQLKADGEPVNATCDFRFWLFDAAAGGTQIGQLQERAGVPLDDGRFTVDLDFGASAFSGDARWLQIAVQCAGDAGYTNLGRQALVATPHALYALGAPWSGLSDVPADLADGDDDTTYTAGTGLSLTGTTFSVDTVAIQRRVTGSCAGGQAIRAIGGDGTVTCETLGVQSHDHWGETWSGSGIGLTLNSSNQDALRIVGGDDGIQVESAIDDGVFISSAGEDGILVDSPGRDGASVVNPGGDGFYVRDAGDDGLDVVSAAGNGVEVDRAENDGVRVDSAGHSGVRVNSAGWDGVWVREAGQAGVLVQSTGGVGVAVDFTGTDGFRVCATGDRLGCTPDSTRSNGLEVGNAQHDGVRVIEAGNDGVYANTSRADHEWGFYTPDRIYAGTTLVTTGPLMMVAQSAGVGPLEPGDVVAASGPAQPFAGGPDPVPLARRADAGSSAGVIGVVFSRFVAEEELYESEGEAGVERHPYYQAHNAAGPVRPGEYMLIVVLGVAQVKVDASAGDIRPGQRLTASELAGHARALRTESLNGMLVSEGAAVVGVALAAPGPGDDTIPVFVTLR